MDLGAQGRISGDEADWLAGYVLSEDCGLSIGLIEFVLGMTIWPDHVIAILGQRGCVSLGAESGSSSAGLCLRRVVQATVAYPCLQGVLAPGLFGARSTQDGMMAWILHVPGTQ